MMSADNWRVCPKCLKKSEKDQAEKVAEAKKKYGQVSSEHFYKLMSAAEAVRKHEETLREDYSIGISDEFVIQVDYFCLCDKCGFSARLQMEKEVEEQAE